MPKLGLQWTAVHARKYCSLWQLLKRKTSAPKEGFNEHKHVKKIKIIILSYL